MAWGPLAPNTIESIPVRERRRRVKLRREYCIVDRREYYVRSCLDLRIAAEKQRFRWVVWIRVPQNDFREILSIWRQLRGRRFIRCSGELGSDLPYDVPTRGLAVELRDAGPGYRPWVVVSSTDHILGREQRAGISLERAYELSGRAMHEWTAPGSAPAPGPTPRDDAA